MSKILFAVLVICLMSISSFAQTGFNYKALIKDANGNVLSNQEIDIRFTIQTLEGPIYIASYQELHSPTTDSNGIAIVTIGEGNIIAGTFPDNFWLPNITLNTEIDIERDGTFVDFGESNFKKVPMAIHADNVFSGDYNDLINPPVITPASGLEQITEETANNSGLFRTGWRLFDADPAKHGPIGDNAIDLSFSISESTTRGATGEHSVAFGLSTTASGKYSTATGIATTASGIYSTALGYGTKAESFRSFAIGSYNIGGGYAGVPENPNSTLSWVGTDPLFEIGNGRNARSNALTVLKNGKVGIGRHQPTSLLEVQHPNVAPTSTNLSNAFSIRNIENESWQFYTQYNGNLHLYNNGVYRGAFLGSSGAYTQTSDRRTKKDITSLENGTLDKVMQLNPVSYLMKAQTDTKRNVGLISQEVQDIFPSITYYVEESDLITLSYTELIPILIKALQEQQDIIEAQKAKDVVQDKSISEQSQTIKSLVVRLDQLEAKSSN
ncbi:tail fiber domain-containing protein [Winogradskyella thalassocola]|nr:tail fiber domain-containing protein [Winogradskyella thalassocola]